MPQENLKRCPFCGSCGAEVTLIQNARYGVMCDKCGCIHDDDNVLPDDAIRAWNTRAPQPQSGDRAKVLSQEALPALKELEELATDGMIADVLANCIRATLTQSEFEVVDTNSVINEVKVAGDDKWTDGFRVAKEAIRSFIVNQGYQIVRKKG